MEFQYHNPQKSHFKKNYLYLKQFNEIKKRELCNGVMWVQNSYNPMYESTYFKFNKKFAEESQTYQHLIKGNSCGACENFFHYQKSKSL